jgi:cold shock CspA family protein
MANQIVNKKGEIFYEAEGTVKSYNTETGYGFIFSIEEDEDIYFHFTQLINETKTIKVGARVGFLYRNLEGKGLRAYLVKELA